MKFSIQARLLGLSMLALTVVGVVTVWLAYGRAVHEVDELIDAQLAQHVRVMLSLAYESDDDEEELETPDIRGHRYESKLLFQIWRTEDGRRNLLLRSPDAPRTWPEGVAHAGYSNASLDDHPWRFFAATDNEGEHQVLAALDLEVRGELAREIAEDNMRPYLVGLPLLALIMWLVIRQGLAPLRQLDDELAHRSPERLDPLPDSGLPRELGPLARTMNGLFGRVARTLDNERRFTSDAAHELRTPLAALRIQLQVAQRTPDDAERSAAIGKALRGADRMTHLVAQLLSLARLENAGAFGELAGLDLGELVEEVIADIEPMAEERGIGLHADLGTVPERQGNAGLLRALVRNLVDNAVRYAPPGGRVEVSLRHSDSGSVLCVADNGAGVSAIERERLGRPFHRFGPQDAEGAGLGLSIARRIVDLHRARLDFGDGLEGRGLSATVTFPLV